ncbi:hypothetical protein [Rhodopirellula baltica]|uniref:Uncharacterized protein n=1 Tax=Rhodopirellula baltica SWK14 TaxID=993516 RepID=L7CJW1_RHOBT|nr:hypothetical protein [Rhodopirellula baltica]ELP34534.1 hypothetical protein RBSWK_01544 [Rhodopirellula baltica SWK14]
MTLQEQLAMSLANIPSQWRDEFTKMLAGKDPSRDFAAFYEADLDAQHEAENVLRLLAGTVFDSVSCDQVDEHLMQR